MSSLSGKVALVTGASSGIGAAIADKLVAMGMTVIGCARNVENIQVLSIGSGGVMQKCSVVLASAITLIYYNPYNLHSYSILYVLII